MKINFSFANIFMPEFFLILYWEFAKGYFLLSII